MNRFSVALCFLTLFFITGGVSAGNKPPKVQRRPPPPPPPPRTATTGVWCVAKNGVTTKTFKEFIGYACPRFGLDCSAIAPGRECNFRKNYKQQASYVLNLYFLKHHTCMGQYGTYAYRNPSVGRCHFEMVDLNH